MKRLLILLLLLSILAGAAACSPTLPADATIDSTPTQKAKPTQAPEPTERLDPKIKEKLKSTFTGLIKKDGTQGAILAVYKGEEVYQQGFGEALEGVPNSPDIMYGAASITKQFTAACILQLHEAGRLSIDDKLTRYFPDYTPGEKITLRHLLCMRSGIPDFSVDSSNGRIRAFCGSQKNPDASVTLYTDVSSEKNIASIRRMFLFLEPIFKPGERFDYSDSNYSLLAAVVEKVSQMPFHDYVRKHIFKPLKMEHSSFIDDSADMRGAVIAQTDRKEFDGDYYAVKGAEFGCGDLLISPRDLYLWYRGLFGGEVLSADSLKLMTSNNSAKGELEYGFGLVLSEIGGYSLMYHFGWIPSSASIIYYLPDQDYCQVVLTNRSAGNPHQLGDMLMEKAIKLLPFQKQSKEKAKETKPKPTVQETVPPTPKATVQAAVKATERPTVPATEPKKK